MERGADSPREWLGAERSRQATVGRYPPAAAFRIRNAGLFTIPVMSADQR